MSKTKAVIVWIWFSRFSVGDAGRSWFLWKGTCRYHWDLLRAACFCITTIRPTTTAAFSAIQCRCGRTFPCNHVFTVFQGGFTVWQVSTTAAFSAIQCRCGRRSWGDCVLETCVSGTCVSLAYHAQPFCNVQDISQIHLVYYKKIRFNNLPDPAYFATKWPFSPISS